MTQVAESRQADAPGASERVTHWINGARVAGTSGRGGPVYNPATGEVARQVDFASVEEVDAAVTAAQGRGQPIAAAALICAMLVACSSTRVASLPLPEGVTGAEIQNMADG